MKQPSLAKNWGAMAFGWTKSVPTKAGYYWWRESPNDAAYVVLVGDAQGFISGLYVWHGPYSNNFADIYGGGNGEWAGPLRPPSTAMVQSNKSNKVAVIADTTVPEMAVEVVFRKKQ